MPEYHLKRWKLIILLGVVGSCIGQLAAQTPSLEQQRQAFKSAWQSVVSFKWDAALQQAQPLTNYPLLPYLRAEQMRSQPDMFSNKEVADYLQSYNDWGFASGLRIAWLRHLGESGQYKSLLQAIATGKVTRDTQVRCHLARARILEPNDSVDQRQLVQQIIELWQVGESQHKSCDAAFDWLQQQGAISSSVAWERVRLAMANNNVSLTRYLDRFLDADHRRWLQRWLSMSSNKNATLKQAINWPNEPFAWEISSWGLQKLARSNPESAWQHFTALNKKFRWSGDYRNKAHHEIGIFRALELETDALAIIDQLPLEAQDQQALEWRARVALATSQWSEVLQSIERMSVEMQADNRWAYWRARALHAMGENLSAQHLWRHLALQPSYYGFMAADLLGQTYNICPAILDDHYDIQDLPRPDQATRALELYRVERVTEATREWRLATADLSLEQNLIAARLAANARWFIQSIFTLTGSQLRQYYSLRFPISYSTLVRDQARQRGLDPALMFGLIRAESAMNPFAISPANARGLMQVTPSTARRLASRHGRVYRGSGSLLQAEINIPFGSLMLQETLSRFNQNMVDVLGAYNAGPHVVDRWHKQQRPAIADIWIETLPYFETRDYIPRVLAFSVIYDWQLHSEVIPITQRMPGLFKSGSPFSPPPANTRRAVECKSTL